MIVYWYHGRGCGYFIFDSMKKICMNISLLLLLTFSLVVVHVKKKIGWKVKWFASFTAHIVWKCSSIVSDMYTEKISYWNLSGMRKWNGINGEGWVERMPSPAEADNAATAMPHNSILLQAQEFFIIRILINMFLLSTPASLYFLSIFLSTSSFHLYLCTEL